MASNKTTETSASVADFINAVEDGGKRKDCIEIMQIMQRQTGLLPKMWGPAIVGFGSYHYQYESGREGDAPLVAFSPRKAAISLYLASEFPQKEKLLSQFGKYSIGKSCISVKKLSDINQEVFKEMITQSLKALKTKYH